MKWLEGNPVGKALAWVCGGLAAISLLLAWAWNWPVSSGFDGSKAAGGEVPEPVAVVTELGPESDYQVINDRPLFNEDRQPVVSVDDESAGVDVEDLAVANTPDVRLTGVVITPQLRLVTLTPNKDGKPVVVREGVPLDGEYVGWTIRNVYARGARLESSEGQSVDLDLAVYTTEIAEPPKPVVQQAASADKAGDGNDGDETAQPLSRAEEIRRRIEERREQLRQEADQQREDKEAAISEGRNRYQTAIQNMIQRKRDNEKDANQRTANGSGGGGR